MFKMGYLTGRGSYSFKDFKITCPAITGGYSDSQKKHLTFNPTKALQFNPSPK